MVTGIALSFLVGIAPAEMPDLRYMQAGQYLARSAEPDPQAAGGFYEGGARSQPIHLGLSGPNELGVRIAREPAGHVRVEVINGGREPQWLSASDSNLQLYLEAKDPKGQWSPIEYQHWSWCGNSRHHVLLPSGRYWEFSSSVPEGPFKTRMRAVLRQDKPIYSNEIEAAIPRERFRLDPDTAKSMKLHLGWAVPTLVPLSMKVDG